MNGWNSSKGMQSRESWGRLQLAGIPQATIGCKPLGRQYHEEGPPPRRLRDTTPISEQQQQQQQERRARRQRQWPWSDRVTGTITRSAPRPTPITASRSSRALRTELLANSGRCRGGRARSTATLALAGPSSQHGRKATAAQACPLFPTRGPGSNSRTDPQHTRYSHGTSALQDTGRERPATVRRSSGGDNKTSIARCPCRDKGEAPSAPVPRGYGPRRTDPGGNVKGGSVGGRRILNAEALANVGDRERAFARVRE